MPTAMEQWAADTSGASIDSDGGVSIDEQSGYATNTSNWSGDEVRASVEAGKAQETGAISSEQEQNINDTLASNDTGEGDSGSNTASDQLQDNLEDARQASDEVYSTTTIGGVDPTESSESDVSESEETVSDAVSEDTDSPSVTTTTTKSETSGSTSSSTSSSTSALWAMLPDFIEPWMVALSALGGLALYGGI